MKLPDDSTLGAIIVSSTVPLLVVTVFAFLFIPAGNAAGGVFGKCAVAFLCGISAFALFYYGFALVVSNRPEEPL